jgi:hypothetical protein
LGAAEFEAVAKAAVEPEKNIRPVNSAMMTLHILDIIVRLLKPVSGGGQSFQGSPAVTCAALTFL